MGYLNVSINSVARDIGNWRREKGFFTPSGEFDALADVHMNDGDLELARLMRSVVKLSQQAEDVRHAEHTPLVRNLRNSTAMVGKLMLVVTELAEAVEAVDKDDRENFREEIADALIRLLDIADSSGMDVDAEIEKKMEANWKRPIKHGKKTNL